MLFWHQWAWLEIIDEFGVEDCNEGSEELGQVIDGQHFESKLVLLLDAVAEGDCGVKIGAANRPTDDDPREHPHSDVDISPLCLLGGDGEPHEHDHGEELEEEYLEFGLSVNMTVFLMGECLQDRLL